MSASIARRENIKARFISPEEAASIQEKLADIAIAAAEIDLDAFLELVSTLGSAQAVAHGMALRVVESASGWSEMAGLLKGFWDAALERIAEIREEDAGT